MAVSALLITDLLGKFLIRKNYKSHVSLCTVEQNFPDILMNSDGVSPIVEQNGITYTFVKHKNIVVLAVTRSNSNAMLIVSFLHSLIELFKGYFQSFEEEAIRDNFVAVYELFDEMMDYGVPQITAKSQLEKLVCVSDYHQIMNINDSRQNITNQVTGAVSWRQEGIVHSKNEVFLDVIEKLDLTLHRNGRVAKCEIRGALMMKCFLSGMPELKLGLNDSVALKRKARNCATKMVQMDDLKFHQCVRLAKFDNDRTISFVPPDGEFELMSYRLEKSVKPLITVECQKQIFNHSRVVYNITTRAAFKKRSSANNVKIIIPVPADADSPKFKATTGNVTYCPEDSSFMWEIKRFNGGKTFEMKAQFGLATISAVDVGEDDASANIPIRVEFEIPYFTVSGIQVRYLKIIEKSGYQALPWVRYITQNGAYHIRT